MPLPPTLPSTPEAPSNARDAKAAVEGSGSHGGGAAEGTPCWERLGGGALRASSPAAGRFSALAGDVMMPSEAACGPPLSLGA
jgi:hypothetical protein